MSKLEILKFPDAFLLGRHLDPDYHLVKSITPEIKQLVSDMEETLDYHKGEGLAARQVGSDYDIVIITERLVGIAARPPLKKRKIVMINPSITDKSEKMQKSREGCLSLPGVFGNVQRHEWVKVEYTELDGSNKIMIASGQLANVIQHEIDHLHGIFFIDNMSKKDKKKLGL